MVILTLKFFWFEHHNIFKVCLSIFRYYAWKCEVQNIFVLFSLILKILYLSKSVRKVNCFFLLFLCGNYFFRIRKRMPRIMLIKSRNPWNISAKHFLDAFFVDLPDDLQKPHHLYKILCIIAPDKFYGLKNRM